MRHWLKSTTNDSEFGLVIDWKFHIQNRWVSAYAPYLIKALIDTFKPHIIDSTWSYNLFKRKIKYIISLEPGWAAPFIRFDRNRHHKIAVFISDPHNKTQWLEDFVRQNDIDYVLSCYLGPFKYHFPNFDYERFVYLPWSVPDQFILDPEQMKFHDQQEIHLFGGVKGDAYHMRRWCKEFDFVKSHTNSGVENKVFTDEDFYYSNRHYDAIIAAGSLSPEYQLVTPKYFEILAAGALLFAQYCGDLQSLGFNEDNCVIFNETNFEKRAQEYLTGPKQYMDIRKAGLDLIMNNHKLSHRIELIKDLFTTNEYGAQCIAR